MTIKPLVLFLHLLQTAVLGYSYGNSNDCDPNKLTVYKVDVQTSWSRELFPKQYPEWRPPAQWSKLIGRSHDTSYSLFQMRSKCTEGMKNFVESGNSDLLDKENQGEGGIFDVFNAPPISQGVGQVDAEFFVDGNHSLVSLSSRVIPSPDWFIGLDSFDLCVEGKWVESVRIELGPLDAGTDNGFTFTSPNWPTVPSKPISRITAQSPNHPANSFYYPDRVDHDPIALVFFQKVKEYELSRIFETTNPKPMMFKKHTILTSAKSSKLRSMKLKTGVVSFGSQGYNEVRSSSNDVLPNDDHHKQSLIKSLVKKYKKKFKKNRKGTRRVRKPRNCKVGDWGEWSTCTKSCGIGEQIRTRKVLKHSRRGGRACPLLTENKWCGSARNCDHKYFDW